MDGTEEKRLTTRREPKKVKKILLVFGTRPEAIKMAPLVKALQCEPDRFDTRVCVTGQHRQMLDRVLEVFRIVPDFDLNIMSPGQDLYDITSRVLQGLRGVFRTYTPDLALVHGDTTTSLAAALAAYYCQIPVGHVEAGLRTYNPLSPWPEEMNRQLADRLCAWHFAPTERAKQNLLQEHISPQHIIVTGNTVIDALLMAVQIIDEQPERRAALQHELSGKGYTVGNRPYVLVTGHRRENFGEGFLQICRALRRLAGLHPEADFVYPVHLNPNVQQPVRSRLEGLPNVYLLPPLDYLPFVFAMRHARLLLTDSGGVQEEAPSLGKPVLVMRDTTERPEAVAAGTVKLVGAHADAIVDGVNRLLADDAAYQSMSHAANPYGDGRACRRIVEALSR